VNGYIIRDLSEGAMKASTTPGESPAMVQTLLSMNVVAAVIFVGIPIALARAE
jgi:hypothetical protein